MFKQGNPDDVSAHLALTKKAKKAVEELIVLRKSGKRASAAKEIEVKQMLWELVQLERDAKPWNRRGA